MKLTTQQQKVLGHRRDLSSNILNLSESADSEVVRLELEKLFSRINDTIHRIQAGLKQ